MKHTPTPYHTDGQMIWDADGNMIATVSNYVDKHPQGTVKPAYTFVERCNAHDELVEALELLFNNTKHAGYCDADECNCHKAKARAILAKLAGK